MLNPDYLDMSRQSRLLAMWYELGSCDHDHHGSFPIDSEQLLGLILYDQQYAEDIVSIVGKSNMAVLGRSMLNWDAKALQRSIAPKESRPPSMRGWSNVTLVPHDATYNARDYGPIS